MSDQTQDHPGASGELPHWWANVPKPLQGGTGEYQPPGYPTTTAFGVPTRFVPGPLNSGRLNQALDELQGQFSGLGLNISAGDTAPAYPAPNGLWWDSVGCQLYVYYNDGTSRQWVPATSLTSISAAITTTAMAAWFATLPTTPPPASGQPWNNGGTLSFTF